MWIGVDYGKKRSGFALSVSGGLAVTALPVLHYPRGPFVKRDSFACIGTRLQEICTSHGSPLQGIVLGDPGEDDPGSVFLHRLIVELRDHLAASLDVPVLLQDERFSSREARDSLQEQGEARRGIRERLDSAAAAVILSRFLQEQAQRG